MSEELYSIVKCAFKDSTNGKKHKEEVHNLKSQFGNVLMSSMTLTSKRTLMMQLPEKQG